MVNGFIIMVTKGAGGRRYGEKRVQFGLSRKEIIDSPPEEKLMPIMDLGFPDIVPREVGELRSIRD